MKNKNRELLKLRQKTLALNDVLSSVSQFSWRIKKVKDSYSLDNLEDLYSYYWELLIILQDFISYIDDDFPKIKQAHKEYSKMLSDLEKGGQDEKEK